MAEEKKYLGYFLVENFNGEGPPKFAFGRKEYVEDVRRRWTAPTQDEPSQPDKGELDEPTNDEEESDFTHASALTDALSASVDFGLAQHELIEGATIAPLILRVALAAVHVIDPITSTSDKIEDSQGYHLYGLNENEYADLVKREERYSLSIKGMERFPTATLLSIVATFDTLVVDILAKMLRLQPDWLEKSERTISLGRLAKAANLEEIMDEQIAEEIYQFSRGSHSEQAEYIRKNFGIDIAKDWRRWPDYIEIFERRNLVAHGESKFNQRYVSICSKSGHKGSDKILGDDVIISRTYLKQSLDILIEFSTLLSFSLFKKFVKEDEGQAFVNLNQAVFKLNCGGHYVVSERIAAYALSLQKSKMKADTRLMLLVNQSTALRHSKRDDEAKKLLQNTDWSAVSDQFKICVASVNGDVEEFIKLIPIVKSSGAISSRSILEWPCFSFMLKEEKVQDALSAAYGLEFKKEVEETSVQKIEDKRPEPEQEDNTVH